jgi:hypothetical protein
MTQPPQACGLILCARVRVEVFPASFNLDALFLGHSFSDFPALAPTFHIYAALFGGRGEGVMELACMELEKERDIYYHKRWIAFSGPARTIHYVVPISKLVFPTPGRYRLTMSFDKEAVAVRMVDVRESPT